MLPLAEIEARLLPLIQCCVVPKMISPQDNVRKASAEAELRIDAHLLSCRWFVDSVLMGGMEYCFFETDDRIFCGKLIRKREDVYRVIRIYAAKGESIAPDAKCFLQCLVRKTESYDFYWLSQTSK